MNKKEIIEKTKKYVREKLEGESSGHDWWHTWRVWQMAKRLAKEENADIFVVELAALLHDIADWKFYGGDDSIGPKKAQEWLKKLRVDENNIYRIRNIIADMPFQGAKVRAEMKTVEGKIVQDADRLDAIGAMGIGRAFAYGGAMKREMFNPMIKPKLHASFSQYKKGKGTTVNHFFEKLLLLQKRMNTKAAKKIAKERHEFMKKYLEIFFKEWEGKL